MNQNNYTLHILNGDGTANGFKESGIAEDFFIWREALALGNVITDIGSDSFNKLRQTYLSKLTNEQISYKPLTKSDFLRKSDSSQYDKIILWFEFDLFCQINMIAVIWLIIKYKLNSRIYLISVDTFRNHPNFKGYGELTGVEQRQLLDQKMELTVSDLNIAARIWELFSSNKQLELQDYVKSNPIKSIPFIRQAIENYFQLFPTIENGLNQIEHDMLERIQAGIETERNLIGSILKDDCYFSLGDLFYSQLLKRLRPLFEDTNSGLKLNEFGTGVLNKELNFNRIVSSYSNSHVNSSGFLFDELQNRLIKI